MSNSVLFPVAAHPDELAKVVELLVTCGLPYQDLTPQHLASFQMVKQDAALVGVVGVERFGDSGLLRSLAVAPAYRGRDLGGNLVAVYGADLGCDLGFGVDHRPGGGGVVGSGMGFSPFYPPDF